MFNVKRAVLARSRTARRIFAAAPRSRFNQGPKAVKSFGPLTPFLPDPPHPGAAERGAV